MKFGLISCSKKKVRSRCSAEQMYSRSPLFRLALTYAKEVYDLVTILSAKYNVIAPTDVIDPYDLTLSKLPVRAREVWSEQAVLNLLSRFHIKSGDEAFFHAGKEYRDLLVQRLTAHRITCVVPLQGLKIGEQMAWYKKALSQDHKHVKPGLGRR